MVDELRTVIGVEGEDDEWIFLDDPFEEREQVLFGDLFHGADDFELSYLVDRIDMVNAFGFITVALVNRVNANEPRAALRLRFPAFSDSDIGRPSLLKTFVHAAVCWTFTEVINVADGYPADGLVAHI